MGRTTDIKFYYSGTWKWVKPLIWAEGPLIGQYWTAAVQGPSSLWVEFAVSPHVLRKRTLYGNAGGKQRAASQPSRPALNQKHSMMWESIVTTAFAQTMSALYRNEQTLPLSVPLRL